MDETTELNRVAKLTVLNASDLLLVLGRAIREQDFTLVTSELCSQLQESVNALRPLLDWK